MFRKYGFTILMVLMVLSGCSKGAIDTTPLQKTADITPLQKAELDFRAYIDALRTLKEQGQPDNLDARDRIQTKYLGISNELLNTLTGIYLHEYREKFGQNTIGMQVGHRPILIAYLCLRYTYPERTEWELREIYRESVKRGEVKAIRANRDENWRWNPE